MYMGNEFIFIDMRFLHGIQVKPSVLNEDNLKYIRRVSSVQRIDIIDTPKKLRLFFENNRDDAMIYTVGFFYNIDLVFHSYPLQQISYHHFEKTDFSLYYEYPLQHFINGKIEDSDDIVKLYCSDDFSKIRDLIKQVTGKKEEEPIEYANFPKGELVSKNLCYFLKIIDGDVDKPNWYLKDVIFKIYGYNSIIDSVGTNVQKFVKRVTDDKPFTFVRVGDGEQYAMLYHYHPEFFWDFHTEKHLWNRKFNRNVNKNRCTFNAKLGKELLDLMNHERLVEECNTGKLLFMFNPQMISISYVFYRLFNDHFVNKKAQFCREHGILGKMLADFPHDFKTMLDFINTKQILLVGPNKSRECQHAIHYKEFVEVPEHNSHEKHDELYEEISSILDKYQEGEEPYFVMLQGGLGIKRLIYDLHLKYGGKHWFFDMGSPIDVFLKCGSNRRYAAEDKMAKSLEIILG